MAALSSSEANMKFGLFNLMQKRDPSLAPKQVFTDLLERVKLAEDLDMERSWLAEHHFTDYCLCPSPLVAAAWLAGHTKKMVFAPGILVLPLYEPVRLAQEFAMVELMAGGRLELGIGVGYQDYEFRGFRVPLKEAGERAVEALDIIEGAFAGGTLDYAGKHNTVRGVGLAVRPENPRPLTYLAGAMTHPTLPRRAVRKGYVPFVYNGWAPFSAVESMRAAYDKTAAEEGVDPKSIGMALERFVYVADTKQEALRAAEQFRYTARAARSLRFDYVQLDGTTIRDQPAKDEPELETIIEAGIIGDVETCAAKISDEIRRARLTHYALLVGVGAMDQKRVMRSIERIGRDVLPLVKRELKLAA
jgi:alkanesulfonate monooxygenase SsuD/methylene tetrahydromethanopterin reductase-like flavin-dependent oxidoreductase (luciferase family)